jgi:hypothetical protein
MRLRAIVNGALTARNFDGRYKNCGENFFCFLNERVTGSVKGFKYGYGKTRLGRGNYRYNLIS